MREPALTLSLSPFGPGWSGIDQAIHAMQSNVATALYDMRVRRACEWILHSAGAKGGDRLQEAKAIYDFVKSRVEYRRDPMWLEFIQDPRLLLARIEETERQLGRGKGWAAGDCDDHAQLAELLGFQVRLDMVSVLVAQDRVYLDMPKADLLEEMRRAFEAEKTPPVHVYAAMRESRLAEPSDEWLSGDDRAPSGLISLDTARPGAAFGKHVEGVVRYVRPAA